MLQESESLYFRRATKFLIEWPPFEYTVLLTIIGKCVIFQNNVVNRSISSLVFLAEIDLLYLHFLLPELNVL
jgi:hypothetical protein